MNVPLQIIRSWTFTSRSISKVLRSFTRTAPFERAGSFPETQTAEYRLWDGVPGHPRDGTPL